MTAAAAAKEEPAGVEAEAALLESFAAIPGIAKAWMMPCQGSEAIQLSVMYAQRNVAANKMRKSVKTLVIPDPSRPEVALPGCPLTQPADAIISSPSPSGGRTIVVRAGEKGESAVFEIWGEAGLDRELVVPSALHGPVYNDGWFGNGVSWNEAEDCVLYVAEEAPPTKTPEWGKGKTAAPDSSDDNDKAKSVPNAAPRGWQGVGPYEDDWGELNTGKRPPRVYALSLTSGKVHALPGTPEATSVGQPIWAPDGRSAICTAWPHDSPNFPTVAARLGIVYCFNRESHLLSLPLPPELGGPPDAAAGTRITPAGTLQAMSPRLSPSGDRLVFLSQQAACETGVHNASVRLCSMAWPADATQEPKVVVDIVDVAPDPADFPGLYCGLFGGGSLLDQPFVGDNTVIVNTQWNTEATSVAVDLTTGAVRRLFANGAEGSTGVLCVKGDVLVATRSLPNQPGDVLVARLAPGPGPLAWSSLTPFAGAGLSSAEKAFAALEGLSWDVIRLEADGTPYEALVLRPAGDAPAPGILFPHGGPHSAYTTSYMMPFAYLASLGYAVVCANFRGSTGFGERSIQTTPGNIGTKDVADCMALLDAAVERGFVDAARVAVVGGSHGGFLTGHLVGQHPDRFKAAVARNPVLNLSVMAYVSDIPDWTYTEAMGGEEGRRRLTNVPTPEDHAKLLEVSPVRYIGNVTTPMMFMLGAKDRRVPWADGAAYVRALRDRRDAPDTRVFVFEEDTHALDRPKTEFEQWVNVAEWLKQHV